MLSVVAVVVDSREMVAIVLDLRSPLAQWILVKLYLRVELH